jgi:hypothetical protein
VKIEIATLLATPAAAQKHRPLALARRRHGGDNFGPAADRARGRTDPWLIRERAEPMLSVFVIHSYHPIAETAGFRQITATAKACHHARLAGRDAG